jgi:large-conductance mechanosensitive channel
VAIPCFVIPAKAGIQWLIDLRGYNGGMNIIIWFLRALILLLAGTFIFISIALYKPDWFRFQPSFSQNVSTLAMILTALATLILAAATFQTIDNSNEQEKRRREEELAKEDRDRKERLLNEIIDWAIALVLQIQGQMTKYFLANIHGRENIILNQGDDVLLNLRAHINNFISDISATSASIIYILHISSKLSTELNKDIIDVVNDLNRYKDYLIQWEKDLGEDVKNHVIVIEIDEKILKRANDVGAHQLTKLAHKVIETATKIKIKNIS